MGSYRMKQGGGVRIDCVFTRWLVVSVLVAANQVQANLDELVTGDNGFDQLQVAAARANQNTFDQLNTGACQGLENSSSGPGQGNCTGDVFSAYANSRELVHTARDLLDRQGDADNQGRSTEFSLGGNAAVLGFALRWTAAEEHAAQGSLSSEFINSSLSSLAARLTALRFGARGFSLVGFSGADDRLIASTVPHSGGGASADSSPGYGRWGGFLDYSYNYGNKDATVLEDAFDFDGGRVNLGVDYRLGDKWVLGAMFSYLAQEIDFESVGNFVVEGGIESDGYNFMPYISYDKGSFFANAAVGLQNVEFDTDRAIRYPSSNPDVSSVNTRSLSNTEAATISFISEFGYQFRFAALAVEPYLGIEYLDTTIDEFTEEDFQVNAADQDDFDLRVGEQDFTSTEVTVGVRVKYVFTPKWSVVIPLLDIQSRSQLEDDARTISAAYTGLGDSPGAADFALPGDPPDDQYYTIAIGFSAVIRGSRPATQGGVSTGGVNIYCKYRTVQGLDNFSQNVLDFGLRYEF